MRIALSAMAVCCALAVTGCTTPPVARPHSDAPKPTPTTTTAPVFSDPRDRIGESCAVLAAVDTELQNATLQHAKGALSDAQFVAIVNTAPTTLQMLKMLVSHGLESDVGALLADTTITPPAVSGETFDPWGEPFRGDMLHAVSSCSQNGTPMGVLIPGNG
ncbi:hypothetical protein [Leifsonia sp. 22587]|uniref:hypothetical protein n=1 Tax=Leifsonia sp. 22587 TaxID=3453946 RepID=UPI0028635C91|nr:hypothetical protein [Leifsonia shinshuensis]